MIRTLNITKFGLYSRFRWLQKMKPFSRVNIIYGRNYSGKTTLSRIFDCVAQGQLHKDYAEAKFEFNDFDNQKKAIPQVNQANLADYKDALVRVYNSDYVSRNLSWLRNEDEGTIRPFALIGSENVEAQREILSIEKELIGYKEQKGLLNELHNKEWERDSKRMSVDSWEDLLQEQIRGFVNLIRPNRHLVKQGELYDLKSLKSEIEQFMKFEDYTPLSPEQQNMMHSIVDDTKKPELEPIPESNEPNLQQLLDVVQHLARKKIGIPQSLNELLADDLLQAWVDQGRELNRDRECCAFCGSPISKERWEQINNHFTKESDDLKRGLADLKNQLSNAGSSMDGFLEKAGFVESNIYSVYHSEYTQLLMAWEAYIWYYREAVGKIIGLIDKRLENIFRPVDDEPLTVDLLMGEHAGNFKSLLDATNLLIEKNNAYTGVLEEKQQGARQLLRYYEIYQFCKKYRYEQKIEEINEGREELKKLEDEAEVLMRQVVELQELKRQKELSMKDESKAARKVTELLTTHFGQGGLTLESEVIPEHVDIEHQDVVLPQTTFIVKRGGEPARNLSDGEKSLISFCYFIAQIENELNGPDAGKLVIFIDDPISSLDSSHIFFMYSLIESVIAAPQRYGQLFISTHNLDFLKYLKRLTVPTEPTRSENISHYVIQKERYGDHEYRSCIAAMPAYLRDYVTEYNFLFEQIYRVAQPLGNKGNKTQMLEHSYSQYYNIGNNMRKFLECYLFFRYPTNEDPLHHLPKLFGTGHVPAEVNRIINEYSHLVFALRGATVMDVPEVETAARHILTALQTHDPEHYAALCQSINEKK